MTPDISDANEPRPRSGLPPALHDATNETSIARRGAGVAGLRVEALADQAARTVDSVSAHVKARLVEARGTGSVIPAGNAFAARRSRGESAEECRLRKGKVCWSRHARDTRTVRPSRPLAEGIWPRQPRAWFEPSCGFRRVQAVWSLSASSDSGTQGEVILHALKIHVSPRVATERDRGSRLGMR